MAIKIIKRAGNPTAVEVPQGTLTPKQIKSEPTQEEREAWWKEHVPPIGAKRKLCEFCQKAYIKPCDEQSHVACANFLILSGKEKVQV